MFIRKDRPRRPVGRLAVVPLQPLITALRPLPDESVRLVDESGSDSLNRHRPSAPHEDGTCPVNASCVLSFFTAFVVLMSASITSVFSPAFNSGKSRLLTSGRPFRSVLPSWSVTIAVMSEESITRISSFASLPLISSALPLVVMTAFVSFVSSAVRE